MSRPKRRLAKLDPKTLARQVVEALIQLYPEPRCGLLHRNAFELLVATILSAQCTDAMVNQVTPALFERFPDALALSRAEIEIVEGLIRRTGFFHAKAKNLVKMARSLVEEHGGEVPNDLDALTKLAGVGRKTANVVLGNAFGIASGVVVDTHVKRLSNRLGLTIQSDPVTIEHELGAIVPRDQWIDFSHRLIDHGRKVCDARRPKCEVCELLAFCPRVGLEPLVVGLVVKKSTHDPAQ